MTDTQWPRYLVLHQDRVGNPHRYAGSVHAPDAEMAMLNARDVFVRRPECVSLWVVRARLVYGLTAEALEVDPYADPSPIEASAESRQHPASLNGGPQSFYVFEKIGHRGVHQHIGEVNALSPAQAMRGALNTFPHKNAVVWWVFPVKSVRQSTPEDIEQLFQIAQTKLYRDQGQYHTVAVLRQIKEQKEQERTQNASGS